MEFKELLIFLFFEKKHITFNLNNNVYIKYGKEDTILDFQVTDINGNQCFHPEKDMNVYNAELKIIKPKPIIKKFSLSVCRPII